MNQVTQDFARSIDMALDNLRKTSPNDLDATMRMAATLYHATLPDELLSVLIEHIKNCDVNDRILNSLILVIQAWDHEEKPLWADETLPHTESRRNTILKLLGFSRDNYAIINTKIRRFTESEVSIVIASEHKPWYSARKKDIRDFYWEHYRMHLEKTWNTSAISILNASIDDVISRLSDPTRKEIYSVKGLVMGYVQSGKTAHFSGLIAKAADAGYRLIIVLSGTLEILRKQTQRRIDMEIVGRELLGPDEYGADADWGKFVAHGGRPREIGYFDWVRLTNKSDDYIALRKYLSIFEFTQLDNATPFYHPDSLRNASAKLAVIKKVPSRINKLYNDLKRLTNEQRSILENVPTLIIDDESDQASVNTVNQAKPGKEGQRSSTNKSIGKLLEILPRAQYVGYTATPFANFFINPDDAEDLFPKDFIVSLHRPDGYMGVSDFYDFDTQFEKNDFNGNENAFVRPVEGSSEDDENLPKAIDSFILAGAIKLYRESKDPKHFKYAHHTMLVHHASKRAIHDEDRQLVEVIFNNGVLYQRKAGLEKLRTLFINDFAPVSKIRASDAPFPESFDELVPFVAQCIKKMHEGMPVRTVNGDNKYKDETPEFEQTPVWSIIVGGTKLSRGYTIEGLTVSYYRRATGAGDTLMQMGRWFGFRRGYKDLVRLFIGRKESKGRRTIDLYEDFGAICRDEEALRADLLKYANSGLIPSRVPPLIKQHLPYLKPTSRNKMFNAEIKSIDFAGDWTEKTVAPKLGKDTKANLESMALLLGKSKINPSIKFSFMNEEGKMYNLNATLGITSGKDVLLFLERYKWEPELNPVRFEISYIQAMLQKRKFKKWHILIPQLQSGKPWTLPNTDITNLFIVERKKLDTRFSAYSDPNHKKVAAFLSGHNEVDKPSTTLLNNQDPECPVLVVYFVKAKGITSSDITVGFGIQYPGQKIDASKAIVWTVKDKANASAVVTDIKP